MGKSYCKTVNIVDKEFIRKCLDSCIDNNSKRVHLGNYLGKLNGIPKRQAERIVSNRHKSDDHFGSYITITQPVVDILYKELSNHTLYFEPIYYREGYDHQSKKERKIGIEHPKQCIADHIAVNAMIDNGKGISKIIGEYQVASMPGRGQLYGANKIIKWLLEDEMHYFIKMDIRKCYDNIDKSRLFAFLSTKIRNNNLLYLIKTLLDTYPDGLSIGSYLSQWCCNIFLSQLYHFTMERLTRISTRRGKTIRRNCVKHAIFYMDDLCIIGTNKKDLIYAAKEMKKFAYDILGLEIKPGWKVQDIRHESHGKQFFIDMMGFRSHSGFKTIRRQVWRAVRKNYIRTKDALENNRLTLHRAYRFMSYHGFVKNTAVSKSIPNDYYDIFMKVGKFISQSTIKLNVC